MKRLALLCAVALACTPLLAQYKVTGPDGKVTYTDRPVIGIEGKVTPLKRDGSAPAGASGGQLPVELRQVAARFPVVLYTAAECSPCDNARRLLKQRGIPLTERQVQYAEDLQQVERNTGGRAMPAMTVGAQAVNGYSERAWQELLDLAGYPRESKLPKDWQGTAPTPLTPKAAPVAAAPPADVPARPAAPEPPAEPTPGGIKF